MQQRKSYNSRALEISQLEEPWLGGHNMDNGDWDLCCSGRSMDEGSPANAKSEHIRRFWRLFAGEGLCDPGHRFAVRKKWKSRCPGVEIDDLHVIAIWTTAVHIDYPFVSN